MQNTSQGKAAYLTSPFMLKKSCELALSCKAKGHDNTALAAIIMSYISAEAFVNELGWLLASVAPDGSPCKKIGVIIQNLDASRVSTESKYRIVSEIIGGDERLDSGREPMQSFILLAKIRNSLVHPRPDDGLPKWISSMKQKGCLDAQADASYESIKVVVQTRKIAVWSCYVSTLIIENLLLHVSQLDMKFPNTTNSVAAILAKMWLKTIDELKAQCSIEDAA